MPQPRTSAADAALILRSTEAYEAWAVLTARTEGPAALRDAARVARIAESLKETPR